ncbi:MAG: dihydrolipoyl dehydrogenase [Candidatus Omnitrophica bacterium]|nr:dihydrolipoyl dehydrogenase [Candidatus Omnitrophota bacterium]MDD5488883.1 dihydrolipoyl dehydrogenase [Candidatus Omnitrophota bacterium]
MGIDHDYIVIGSGPAGHMAAIKAAQGGLKTLVIEKDPDMLGGVCLNEGCIPAKSLYSSAGILARIKRSPGMFGIGSSNVTPDIMAFVGKSRKDAETLREGLKYVFKKNNIDVMYGRARFTGPDTLAVTSDEGVETVLGVKKALIAVGSFPRQLDSAAFDGEHVLSSSDAIRLGKVPGKMIIIGGGAIGVEFASFFSILGTEITLIEFEKSLLPREDAEVSRRLGSIFKKQGIKVMTSSSVTGVSISGDKVSVQVSSSTGDSYVAGDMVIVSVGRAPSTSALGLDEAGIEVDDRGFIRVDTGMATSAPGIYAAGDVVRTPMLAHVAYAEGELAALSALGQATSPIAYEDIPNAVYSEIEIASVGLTEESAKEKGLEYGIGKQFFRSCGRAVVQGDTEGFVKVIADKRTRKILGAHIIGHQAAELIHELVIARHNGITIDGITGSVHAHPTVSETILDACRGVFGPPIHG